MNTRFIELAGEVNTNMLRHVIERTAEALNQHQKPLNGSPALVLGAAYKREVDDMRESPALRIIDLLEDRGANVQYHDPFIPKLRPTRHYEIEMESVELSSQNLAQTDAVVIVTDHTGVDYESVVEHAPIVVDTRNATKNVQKSRDKIVKA